MLILFDIDGTLLLTQGAGIKAMRDAGRELYGQGTLIWQDLVRINGIADEVADHDVFRNAYGRHLGSRLERERSAKLLPGVEDLVHQLNRTPQLTLGLLTGNYPETGRMKIKHAGLDPDVFAIAAWGCEGTCRRDLPPIAMERHRERAGAATACDRVVIIGDTPHDIDCAKAHGCRSIGVATGMFTVDSLRLAGADLAVNDLSDTGAITSWMLNDGTMLSH
jgi:phosphoglycolate phosphatase-like HAD superfamily hydrolase